MVLATYRPSELAERHPLKEMFDEAHVGVAIPDVIHLALDGLDAPSVAAFVEAAAGSELDDAGGRFARTLHSETGGNPFFVSEIVSSLMESGALGGDDSDGSTTWPQHVRVPPAARDVVLRRVADSPTTRSTR